MNLEVRLFTGLKCNNPELPCFGKNEFRLDVADGTTIGELLDILKLEAQDTLIKMVNGLARADDWVLNQEDRVGIFPPVGGG